MWKRIEDETPKDGQMLVCEGLEGGIFFCRSAEIHEKNGRIYVFAGGTWRGIVKWMLIEKEK